MLPRTQRLPASTRLAAQKIVQTPFFTMRFARNHFDHNRYGFVVGKRVDKRAVVRNRVKLRRFFEEQRSIQQGYDFLFVVKKEAVFQSTQELWQVLAAALKKENLL
jgi:ribonuclease P protein component